MSPSPWTRLRFWPPATAGLPLEPLVNAGFAGKRRVLLAVMLFGEDGGTGNDIVLPLVMLATMRSLTLS